MSINAIDIATVTRSQDLVGFKHNADMHPAVNQNNIMISQEKNIDKRMHDVTSKDAAGWQNKKFDAKEKGANEYQKPKEKEKTEGSVKKAPSGNVKHSGFDISI